MISDGFQLSHKLSHTIRFLIDILTMSINFHFQLSQLFTEFFQLKQSDWISVLSFRPHFRLFSKLTNRFSTDVRLIWVFSEIHMSTNLFSCTFPSRRRILRIFLGWQAPPIFRKSHFQTENIIFQQKLERFCFLKLRDTVATPFSRFRKRKVDFFGKKTRNHRIWNSISIFRGFQSFSGKNWVFAYEIAKWRGHSTHELLNTKFPPNLAEKWWFLSENVWNWYFSKSGRVFQPGFFEFFLKIEIFRDSGMGSGRRGIGSNKK